MIERYPRTPEETLVRIREGIDTDNPLNYLTVQELTSQQLERLKALNLELVVYEKQIIVQIQDIKKLAKEVNQIEIIMSFYLAEGDTYFSNKSDNLLMTMTQDISIHTEVYGICDGLNHNDFQAWTADKMLDKKDHPMCNDYHCWSFHSLYDHTELEWEEILRIGKISIDIKLNMDQVG